ncbi:MAG: nitrate ABC transporter permease [Acidiferrobacteraceae bacterium]|nr:nitrate ABC transporter permease [Acidiferrobacteraceae bacterium]
MSNAVTSDTGGRFLAILTIIVKRVLYAAIGLGVLYFFWWLGGWLLYNDPATRSFATFGPMSAFDEVPYLIEDGTISRAINASSYRLGMGLLVAILTGVPVGILMGRSRVFKQLSNTPFQFLRMVSPLSWEPIAVIAFPTWDSAIIFLIAMAAVWPVAFATAAGLAKLDPAWFKVSRNLGAKPWHMLTQIILPAIAFDVLTGVRLAVGVAWIVIVPAEFLGVTSGLGYSIQDARENLMYEHLAVLILVIGAIGFVLDGICTALIKRYSWHRQV